MNALAYQPGDLKLEPVDGDKAKVIVKAVVRAANDWKLSNAYAAALFDVSPPTWSRYKKGAQIGRLDQDKMTRASLLIGIYKGLRLLFNGPLTHQWLMRPNSGPTFQGLTPADYMKRGGIPAMMKVRQHIDALRGGL